MTSNSPQPPDLDRVEKGFKAIAGLTNTLMELLRLVAGMIRKRQWVDLLMFASAIAIVFICTKFTLAQFVKEPIFYGAWMGLGLIFLVGLGLELRKKPAFKTIVPGKRRAIKFLSSFELEDAEIYERLQGYRDLGILENIILPDFSFGVLKGRSGCGKSSYLKAGLLAALAKTEAYRGVYIKFSNLDPLGTIREALVEVLKLPKADVETLGLIELLNRGIEAAAEGSPSFKSLILIFDQFEQFFVYTDDAERRSSFIQALANWYGTDELKEKVKILVSIREDWFARMDEIQAVLDYTLRVGGQTGSNSFYLKNFSAEEATMILGVMAQEDLGIEAEDTVRFDRDYIQEVLERELASPTDHLVSPIDLQIIAETIKQQNIAELRSFNRSTLQKLGGIEGLRRSFLERILEPFGAERQKSAVQVLVALTNLEQQTPANVQTLLQLQEKLAEVVHSHEVIKIVENLQGTALIAVVERDGIKGYELSHEGMIDAVIRLGEKVHDKAYRANQLLERRVNEWLGNNRSSRYLFNLRELWLLEQQNPYLVWGNRQQQKTQLIEKSTSRIYEILKIFGIFILIFIGVWVVWNNTTFGQMTQIRRNLFIVSQQINDPNIKSKAAVAFAKNENFEESSKLMNKIQDVSYNASDLSRIVEVYGKLKKSEKAAPLLEKAITSVKKNQDFSEKSSILSNIAEVYSNLGQPEKAAPLIEKAITSVNWREEKVYRQFVVFRKITEAIGNLEQHEKAAPLLEKATISAHKIQDFWFKASALSIIAKTYDKFKQTPLLEKGTPANKNQVFSKKSYGKLNQALLLEAAMASVNQIQNPSDKSSALSSIAEAIGSLNQTQETSLILILETLITSTNQIPDSFLKSSALSSIAKAISSLNQLEEAVPLLEKLIASANQIQNFSDKASILSSIAQAIGNLKQPKEATPLLEQVIASANQIQNFFDKASALSSIAQAFDNLKQRKRAAFLFKEAIISANQIQSSYEKDSVISSIVEAEAMSRNWGEALNITQLCISKNCEVESLAKILTVYAEQQHPELKEEEEE